jgi:hypothetical protein
VSAKKPRRCRPASAAELDRDPYVPLDEWLQMPRTRILRALRFFDWAEGSDLRIACGVVEDDKGASDRHNATIKRLIEGGLVQRRRIGATYEYRLAPGARAVPPPLAEPRETDAIGAEPVGAEP